MMYDTNTTSKAQKMVRRRIVRTSGVALLSAIGSLILCKTSIIASAQEDISQRIVGGTDASPGQYRFFSSWAGSCGATLIHDDILLTAAHVRGYSRMSHFGDTFGRNCLGKKFAVLSTIFVPPFLDTHSRRFAPSFLELHSPIRSSIHLFPVLSSI
jgi:hypothetical protein